jgi:hypothetical protein
MYKEEEGSHVLGLPPYVGDHSMIHPLLISCLYDDSTLKDCKYKAIYMLGI